MTIQKVLCYESVPQNSHVGNNPQFNSVGQWGIWGSVQAMKALPSGKDLCCCKKGFQETVLALCCSSACLQVRIQHESPQMTDTLILNFQVSKSVKNYFIFLINVLVCYSITRQTKIEGQPIFENYSFQCYFSCGGELIAHALEVEPVFTVDI